MTENDPIDEWIREQLDIAPPLSSEQLDLIRRALNP